MKSILTAMPEGPAYEFVSAELGLRDVTDYNVSISEHAQVGHLCYDTAFAQSAPKFAKVVDDKSLIGGTLTRPGITKSEGTAYKRA